MRIAHSLRVLVAVLFLAAIFFPVSALVSKDNSTIVVVQRSRRNVRDPLSNPWLHSKQDLQQFLWKKSGETGDPIDCCPSVLEMVEPNGGTNRYGMYVELYQNGDVKQRFYELSCDKSVEGRPCRFMDRKLHNMSKCVQKWSFSYALVREQQAMGFVMDPDINDDAASAASLDEELPVSDVPNARHHHQQQPHSRHHSHNHHQHHAAGNAFPLPSAAGPGGSGWMLDYIKVRSGCSCEVTPKPKKKRTSMHKIKKSKTKKYMYLEEDDISSI